MTDEANVDWEQRNAQRIFPRVAAFQRAIRTAKLALMLPLMSLVGCAAAQPPLARSEPVAVVEVKNLAGVPLRIPAMYFGDALGAAEALQVEKLDLRLLARAGLLSELEKRGYAAQLDGEARMELHAAMTVLDLDGLRDSGRVRLGMVVMVVDAHQKLETARGEVTREFRLLDVAPEEGGALGQGRFIADRLKGFVEALASEALHAAGLD